MQKAIETYDNYANSAGVVEEGKEPLAPIGHIIGAANVEVQIDKHGKFVAASFFFTKKKEEEKEKKTTKKIIIPVTEKSASRSSSAKEPHGLCEKLKHIDGNNDSYYKAYTDQLEAWLSFRYDEKLEAILKYVKGKTISNDLKKFKLAVKPDDMIAWRVLGTDGVSAVWEDKNLFNSWTDYMLEKVKVNEAPILSQVSGEYGAAAIKHIKGVVPFAPNAKLISSNDDTVYAYKGRFQQEEEALQISYADSQKAHNALRWIIANNGVFVGDKEKRLRTFVCWNPYRKIQKNVLVESEVVEENLADYKDSLRRLLYSAKNDLDKDPKKNSIVIASFEAATKGRLAITYYQELQTADFVKRTVDWAETCYWNRWVNGSMVVESPNLRDIVKFAFGLPEDEKITISPKVEGMHLQRLMLCRIDGYSLPDDIVKALVRNFSSPLRYKGQYAGKMLFVACAVLKKYRHDKYKEEWDIMLDPEKKDRSYQFGRLLAVMEKAERDTYSENENREPNAVRLREIFSRRPDDTSKTIIEKLESAYFRKLKPASRVYYKALINEIYDKISECDGEINTPLDATYLFGYSSQNVELYKKKKND